MRLISFNCREPIALPGIRTSNTATVDLASEFWSKWRVHVRGPAVILESPPGWSPSTTRAPQSAIGPRTAFEFPRSSVNLRWELEPGDSLADIVNWSSPVAAKDLPDVGEKVMHAATPIMDAIRSSEALMSGVNSAAFDAGVGPFDDKEPPPVAIPRTETVDEDEPEPAIHTPRRRRIQ